MDSVALVLRFTLATVFIVASLAKLPRLTDFAAVIRQYQVLPPSIVRPVAICLPIVELISGAMLAVGVALIPVSLVVATLLFAFTFVAALILSKGRKLDCGCFSLSAPTRITWITVGRNILLLLAAVFVALAHPVSLSVDAALIGTNHSHVSHTDAVALAAVAVLGLSFYGIVIDLIRLHRARVRLLKVAS